MYRARALPARPIPFTLFVLLAALATGASVVSGAPFDNRCKILIHVGPPAGPAACAPAAVPCARLTTSGDLSAHYAYLVAARGSMYGLAGIECGIQYGGGAASAVDDGLGIDIFSWNLCADAFYPSPGPNQWPRPGGGALIVWDRTTRCQTTEFSVAGYFYMAAYTPDVLQVIRRPSSGAARLANCLNMEFTLAGSDLGSAAFGSGPGCNSCARNCPDPPTPPYVLPGTEPPPPPQTGDPGIPWVLLHTQPAAGGNICARGRLEDPADAVVSAGLSRPGTGPFHHVFLLVARDHLTSLSGLSAGIMYENGAAGGNVNGTGLDILSWNLCADMEVRSTADRAWPEPGSGNLILWNPQGNCRTGRVEVAGYFYVAAYAPDRLEVTRRPGTANVEIINCALPRTIVSAGHLGSVSFSENAAVAGSNPWLDEHGREGKRVERATWSGVKSLIAGR